MMRISGLTRRLDWRRLAVFHGLPLLFYLSLNLALTWPVARDLTTQTAGANDDVRHYLWILWHVKEWLLGRQALYTASQLYYPAGITTLVQSTGPLTGLMALPFWPFGPVAAFNGLMLAGQTLSSYAMYLLSRELGQRLPSALFAGLLFMVIPIHLAATYGRIDFAFLGLLPLALLALHRMFRRGSSRWWSLVAALILGLTLFQHALLFIFSTMAVLFFSLVFLLKAERDFRRELLTRLGLMTLLTLLLSGPLLLAMAQVSRDSTLGVDMNLASLDYQPDFIELFLPPSNSLFLGQLATAVIQRFNLVHNSVETWIYLTGSGLLLYAIALLGRQKKALPWLLFALLMALLALGPSLQLLGRRHFTEYGLEIILPYAIFTALPGVDFLRTPGRFLIPGSIGLAIAAAYGLDWLGRRFPRMEWPLAIVFMILLLLEIWPEPWPQGRLPDSSPFYEQIAGDGEMYGIFDIPVKEHPWQSAVDYSSRYQVFQMVHGKGIAGGYLSRTYGEHPVLPCLFPEIVSTPDISINGEPLSCAENALYDLSTNNYRYVVRHKPQGGEVLQHQDSWGEVQAQAFIRHYFEDQEPVYEDGLLAVYTVPPPGQIEPLPLVGALADNWYGREDSWRWAQSPATIRLTAARPFSATMVLVPAMFYQPDGRVEGHLIIEMEGGRSTMASIQPDEPLEVPLSIRAGDQQMTLRLEAGNFSPVDQGESDPRILSFAIRSIDFRLH